MRTSESHDAVEGFLADHEVVEIDAEPEASLELLTALKRDETTASLCYLQQKASIYRSTWVVDGDLDEGVIERIDALLISMIERRIEQVAADVLDADEIEAVIVA